MNKREQEKEHYRLFESVLNQPHVADTNKLGKPQDYISSIESSGMPKKEYIMNKYRASTIDYIIENNPPVLLNNNKITTTTTTTTTTSSNKPIINLSESVNFSPPLNILLRSRSKSCPPAKELPCNHCKKIYPREELDGCERCGNGLYCSDDCQYENWKEHRSSCRSLNQVVKMSRNNSF